MYDPSIHRLLYFLHQLKTISEPGTLPVMDVYVHRQTLSEAEELHCISRQETRSSAVVVLASHTACDVWCSYRPLAGIVMISISIYLFTVSD